MASISTVVTVDFFRRLRSHPRSRLQELRLARTVTVATGVLAVLVSFWLMDIPEEKRGNITDLSSRIGFIMLGPMGGLFLVAIVIKGCIGPVAILSTLLGLAAAFILALGHLFLDLGTHAGGHLRSFSWMWVLPTGCSVSFLSAAAITWLQKWLSSRD